MAIRLSHGRHSHDHEGFFHSPSGKSFMIMNGGVMGPGFRICLAMPQRPLSHDHRECPADAYHRSGSWARCGCRDRKSTRLNSSHLVISYAVFCLKKKKKKTKKKQIKKKKKKI